MAFLRSIPYFQTLPFPSLKALLFCYSPKKKMKMDRRRDQFQPLGICSRLFDIVTETISALAIKFLALGSPVYRGMAFCHRLFDYIMETLAAQAVKPVVLGPPVLNPVSVSGESQNCCSCTSDQNVQPMAHGLPCEMVNPRARVEPEQVLEKDGSHPDMGKSPQEVEPAPTFVAQARAPKKMVSINDTVEEIYPRKGEWRKKSTEKLPSLEREADQQKPLKSILKVRSSVKNERDNGD